MILEAPGDEYNAGMSRISTWTGLPTVVGWTGHEGQWRGNYDIQGPRVTQIQEIYTTGDANRMLELLKELKVRYRDRGAERAALVSGRRAGEVRAVFAGGVPARAGHDLSGAVE